MSNHEASQPLPDFPTAPKRIGDAPDPARMREQRERMLNGTTTEPLPSRGISDVGKMLQASIDEQHENNRKGREKHGA